MFLLKHYFENCTSTFPRALLKQSFNYQRTG